MFYKLSAMDNPKGTFPFDQKGYVPLFYNEALENKIQNITNINIRNILQKNALDYGVNFWFGVDWEKCLQQFICLYNFLIEKLPTYPQEVDMVNYVGSFIMLLRIANNWSKNNTERSSYIMLACK